MIVLFYDNTARWTNWFKKSILKLSYISYYISYYYTYHKQIL